MVELSAVKLSSMVIVGFVWLSSGMVQSILPVALLEKSGVTFATSNWSAPKSKVSFKTMLVRFVFPVLVILMVNRTAWVTFTWFAVVRFFLMVTFGGS